MSALLDNKLPANPATNPSGEPAKPRKPIKVTAKRRAANRRNARLSTGPKTEEGKSRSRENALKHGMAGAGVVMHAADLGPLQIRLDQWTETLQPADPVEGWLVGRAALASVRVDRCAREEQVQFLDRVAGTTRKWDEGRLQLVEERGQTDRHATCDGGRALALGVARLRLADAAVATARAVLDHRRPLEGRHADEGLATARPGGAADDRNRVRSWSVSGRTCWPRRLPC